MATSTPWGAAQYSKKYARGIIFYSTAGHGGFHLSPTVNSKVPEALRIEDGWYEEDCDWALVFVSFPEIFKKEYANAIQAVRDWHPDRYEKHFGVELRPDESYMKRRELAKQESVVAQNGSC